MVKKKRRKPRKSRTGFLGVLLLIVGTLAVLYWLWSCIYAVSPRFSFMVIEKNGERLKLLNGETLQLHPQNRLKVRQISTNICFNYGIRLFSKDLDVNALLYEEKTVAHLLPGRDVFNRFAFTIEIKRYNEVLGRLDVLVEPYVEDWLDKAARTIDPARRRALLERAMKAAPEHGPIRDRLLEEYISQKKWSQALELLEAMIKEKPEKETLLKILRIHEVTSNTGGTISLLKRILKADPDDLETRLRLATILEAEKIYGEAIREYENLLKHTEKSEALEIYKTLGFLYTKTKNPQRAIESYLGAVQLNEKDANLFYNLSSLYEMTGAPRKADTYLEKAVKLNSGDKQGRIRLAENFLKQGKLEEAEDHLSVLLKKDPESMEALLLLSSIAEKRGDKKALKKHYKKILSLDSKNATLMYNIGVLEYESGNLPESLPHFETYVKYFPQDKEVHGLLFEIYKSLDKPDLAFNEAKTLMVLKPKDKGLYLFIAEHLYNRKNYKELLSICRKGLALFPGESELEKYLILSYLKTGQDDLAIKKMRELLKVRPKDKALLLQLAKLEDKKGKEEEALESYGKLLKLSPKNKEAQGAFIRLTLVQGNEQEKRGKIKEALASYRRVMKFAPKNKEAKKSYTRLLLKQAVQLEKQGKLKEAMGAYKKVMDLVPDHEQAQEAYLRLRMEDLPVE